LSEKTFLNLVVELLSYYACGGVIIIMLFII